MSKQEVHYLEIDESHAGQRLDNFLLSYLKPLPKSAIYRLLRRGEVRVNKKRAKPADRLALGDAIRIPPITRPDKDTPVVSNFRQEQIESAVIYEDQDLLVLNKPAGVPVHGGSGVNAGVIEILRQARPDAKFLELVHRLDKGTSGCLLIAKNRQALLHLQSQIKANNVKKTYHALVAGKWPKSLNKIDLPLKKNTLSSGARIVRADPEGKAALTTFRILKNYKDCTLIEARLHTGRTHQIRVHCQHAGHPILGDGKYGMRSICQAIEKAHKIKRMCLHAAELQFELPSGERTTVTAHCEDFNESTAL